MNSNINSTLNLGLACMMKTKGFEFKTMTKATFTQLKIKHADVAFELKSKILHNLHNTYQILKWCVKNDIHMYRFPSSLIPLATLEEVWQHTWNWYTDSDIRQAFNKIKGFVQKHNIRTSFHPDQFCVLTNWTNEQIFENSLKDLEYHNLMCDLLGCETIILHIGGVYGNKVKAIETFITHYYQLPEQIRNRLYFENDDRSYNVQDVLEICEGIDRPMILDFHHSTCLNSPQSIEFYLSRIISTWGNKRPKCHLSTGKLHKKDRSHSDYISIDDFNYVRDLVGDRFDIMVEAKAKELAILELKGVVDG
jgi:UV DNA damage endonuclease